MKKDVSLLHTVRIVPLANQVHLETFFNKMPDRIEEPVRNQNLNTSANILQIYTEMLQDLRFPAKQCQQLYL